jgi:hypothetical protein
MYLIYCSFFVVCTNNLSVLTNVSKVSIFSVVDFELHLKRGERERKREDFLID